MLDSIDPPEYWDNEVSFPILRERRLVCSDFFAEDKEGFRTDKDAETYDLVLGNAPWGENTLTPIASLWQKMPENKDKWKDSYKNIASSA